MEDEHSFTNWVELPEGLPVRFSQLPSLIACALHTNPITQAGANMDIRAELRDMAKRGELPLLNWLTRGPASFPYGQALEDSLILPTALRPVLAARGIGLRLTKTQPKTEAKTSAPDFSVLATRQQLIEAFGSLTGMDASWFANLNDSPNLKAARRVVGQGGRGHIAQPYFCPSQVLQWLLDPKRKKGRRLLTTEAKGRAWRQLEAHFPTVYRQFSIGDIRTD